jgi:hypothetical protein
VRQELEKDRAGALLESEVVAVVDGDPKGELRGLKLEMKPVAVGVREKPCCFDVGCGDFASAASDPVATEVYVHTPTDIGGVRDPREGGHERQKQKAAGQIEEKGAPEPSGRGLRRASRSRQRHPRFARHAPILAQT